jgi:hypothetical protein
VVRFYQENLEFKKLKKKEKISQRRMLFNLLPGIFVFEE